MNRQRALDLLSRSKPELQARFGVTRLALFGSTARDTASSGSDVDVLVAFDGPATRNRLIHGYLGIDDDTLWSIIQDDVPELLPLLKALKNEAQS
jgi:hypothetical protein